MEVSVICQRGNRGKLSYYDKAGDKERKNNQLKGEIFFLVVLDLISLTKRCICISDKMVKLKTEVQNTEAAKRSKNKEKKTNEWDSESTIKCRISTPFCFYLQDGTY